MADIRLGNLFWKDNTQPNSVNNPVNTKDVNSDSTKAELTAVKNELELVKAELQEIKANQLSGDQKVQLSGKSVTHELGSGNFAQIVGETVGGRESFNFTPFSMRSHRRFTIYIDNTENIVGISGGMELRLYTTDEITSGGDYFYSKTFSTVPAGGEFIIDSSDEVFDILAMGLGFTVYSRSSDNPEDVTYSVTIMGGN